MSKKKRPSPGPVEKGRTSNFPLYSRLPRHGLWMGMLLVFSFLLYFPSLKGEFLCDDHFLVKENQRIRLFSNAASFFTGNIAAGGGDNWNSYRPVQMLTYAMDYRIWKLRPLGYHLTNIFLHGAVAAGLYFLFFLLGTAPAFSFFGALIFLVHPVHVGAVAFISGRADPLALLFMVAALILSLRFPPTLPALISFAGLYFLALFSRESSFIFPFLCLSVFMILRKRTALPFFFTALAVGLILSAIRFTFLSETLSQITYETTGLERFPGFFAAFASYVRLLLVPHSLHTRYGHTLFSFSNPQVILGLLLFSCFIFLIWKGRKGKGPVFLGMVWFGVALAPLTNVFPALNAYMAEHWLYVPAVGLALCAAKGLQVLSIRHPMGSSGIAIGITLYFSLFTYFQTGYWSDEIRFYKKTLLYTPDKAQTWYNLGVTQERKGHFLDAKVSYNKSIQTQPDFPLAWGNLASLYLSEGKPDSAAPFLERALQLDPKNTAACNNMGGLLYLRGDRKKAREWFLKSVEVNPDFTDAWSNLGILYMTSGQDSMALIAFKNVLRIDGNNAKAKRNIGHIQSRAKP